MNPILTRIPSVMNLLDGRSASFPNFSLLHLATSLTAVNLHQHMRSFIETLSPVLGAATTFLNSNQANLRIAVGSMRLGFWKRRTIGLSAILTSFEMCWRLVLQNHFIGRISDSQYSIVSRRLLNLHSFIYLLPLNSSPSVPHKTCFLY
jgi:hypothetical protein